MPLNELGRMQTRSSANRDLYETINALLSGSEKADLSALLVKQDEDSTGDAEHQRRISDNTAINYIQALLGIHPGNESTPLSSALKNKFAAVSRINRPRSVSFSTPEVREGFLRGAAALQQGISNIPGSPIRGRSHASESGSPTLEQALLMGRDSPESDAGYGSFLSGTAEYSSLSDLRRAECEDSLSSGSRLEERSFSPGEARPTLASLVEADLAVAQAVQNLQDLKERQVAMYQEVGVSTQACKEPNLLAALLSSATPTTSRPLGIQGGTEDLQQSHRNRYVDSSFFDREDRETSFDTREYHERTRDPLALERAAKQYRSAASQHEANCTWSGQLPPKQIAGRQPSYSSKIFLGGVPWDITETTLIQAFIEFGPVRVEWPGRDAASPPRGYLYIVFEDEDRVQELLAHCTHDFANGGSFYFKISSKKRGSKEIQIIPWNVADSNYVRFPSPRLDPKKTVFVGALHGMINAQSLAVIFNDLFGGVVYAGLDTDKHKYPIGSGRVTFNNAKSYMKAVAAAFIEIKTPRFCKKVQVDPYLEDALCSVCHMKQGPYFCRDLNCFNYYCRTCWDNQHAHHTQHKPLMRNIRGLTRARLQDILPGSNECYSSYSSYYQGQREPRTSNFWTYQNQVQCPLHIEKRSDLENWRAPAALLRSDPEWRPEPEITWRKTDTNTGVSWPGQSVDYSDEYSKIAASFAEHVTISKERKPGLKPFFDKDQRSVFDNSLSTPRSFFDKDMPTPRSVFDRDSSTPRSDVLTPLSDREYFTPRSSVLRGGLDRETSTPQFVYGVDQPSYSELEGEKSNFKPLFDKDTPSFVPFMYREENTDATGGLCPLLERRDEEAN
ncbi:uncharacterized protein LOC111703576 [Eurytemora carolleeae]|uniref:uncharacterized protein LOC111703576 n=1 Tax=Eurytemora carolleeae TaxID=1294199 RepID=UPI000C76D636|nr:uncharacterized protein LOC111703576 [Eurytemora carolleeae]|eukprot:XP_023331326.1 uncharacterized protein LOC111703576 [Eurytemora affinis]